MFALNLRALIIAGIMLVALALFATNVLAKPPDGGQKPGWGWGDPNHEHTGPPGGPSEHPVFGTP